MTGKLPELNTYCDSSVARSISIRAGIGRVKHLEVKQLWSQERVADGSRVVHKIPMKQNPADTLTHKCTAEELENFLRKLSARCA